MDPIKDAFFKVKQDISELKYQISYLAKNLSLLKEMIESKLPQTDQQTDKHIIPADPLQNPAENIPQEDIQTDKTMFKGSKDQFSDISIGNGGVPADRQTDQQTDRQTPNTHKKFVQSSNPISSVSLQDFSYPPAQVWRSKNINEIDRVSQLLESLDEIKKDLRIKFKKLTPQEMLIFSTIYQLEEQGFTVDYSLIASKISLSESSIRDYIQKLLKKGVPIIKIKENNKRITLSIPSDFKRVASLQTLESLREI
ncbi:MAG: hypothetical protein Q7S74_02565 [Nanoarchaeota archaeon]|nr:hypothetical protein [Nanoarchaeota archaeon]